jgi:PAS domain S-box-containing protein
MLRRLTIHLDVMIAMLKQKAKALEMEIERRKSVEGTLQRYLALLSARAEESLRHQQESYRTLLSILPVGVYSSPMAHDGEFIFVNERFCELSGLAEHELRTDGWVNAVHPEDRDLVRHLWDSSHPSFGGKQEYRYVLLDGTIRWVTGETVPFISHNGKSLTYVHTIVDITELKEVEKQRERASKKAEELLRHRVQQVERHKREQDQFIDTLCHELRNPLSSIHGNVELIRLGVDLRDSILVSDSINLRDVERLREQARWDEESISAIEKCLAHQKVITDDVLDLSKLEVGKVMLHNVEFNPKTTIIDATKMFDAEANQKGVTLRFNLPVSDVIVKADPDRVSQVLINLLANALKFTPEGSITLGMDIIERKKGRMLVKITVKDDGIGLTKQEKAKLFHRFMQPTSSSYQECGGSGLGLVISKNLVELMGGTIFVESEKGMGSEFTFTFSAEECTQTRPNTCLGPRPATAKRYKSRRIQHILVVEDNLINQRFLVRLLEIAGYKCSTALNGAEALECMDEKRFDLILMDVQMPVMDGMASSREIRLREVRDGLPPIPIIGLSGNARDEHRVEALRSGMNYYLTKPCKKDELYSVIEKFDSQIWDELVKDLVSIV